VKNDVTTKWGRSAVATGAAIFGDTLSRNLSRNGLEIQKVGQTPARRADEWQPKLSTVLFAPKNAF
jgi:hypothetical protein